MSATTEEVTIDLAAIDAEKAKKAEKQQKTGEKQPQEQAAVIVDPEITTKQTDAAALTPEQGIEKLKNDLKAEKEARTAAESARAAAEQRAAEAARGEADARTRAQASDLDLVKSAIATVTQANDQLEAQCAEAMAAQDWQRFAKLQRQMSDNSAKLAQLEAGKTQLEKQPKPVPRASADPVEVFAANLTAPSAAWVRAHPEFVRDKQKNAQMIAAHELAIARGCKADTDEYFKSIEKTLDLAPTATVSNGNGASHAGEADPLADPSATAATGGRQAAPAAAPVSRSPAGANGTRPNVVRLTADEVEMAQNMGMTPEDYARNKLALKKEGKLS